MHGGMTRNVDKVGCRDFTHAWTQPAFATLSARTRARQRLAHLRGRMGTTAPLHLKRCIRCWHDSIRAACTAGVCRYRGVNGTVVLRWCGHSSIEYVPSLHSLNFTHRCAPGRKHKGLLSDRRPRHALAPVWTHRPFAASLVNNYD